MNLIHDSKQINLCSKYATISNGSLKSSMVYQLNNILKKEPNILYNYVSVVHAEIPLSFYIINSTNNLLVINNITYTLTTGDYNANTFVTMILTILPASFTLVYNNTSTRYTLTNSLADFTINVGSTCGTIFGFLSNKSYTSTNKTLALPNPCNFLGPVLIKIKSNMLQSNNIDSSSGGRNNTISTIQVNSSANGLLLYNNFTNFKSLFPNTSLDYIDISLTDEYDNIIDFDGIDNFITLQIDTFREYIAETGDFHDLVNKERLINLENEN
jgi:hypothetical protein